MDEKNATTKRKFPKDLAGQRFGRLVARVRKEDYVSPKGSRLQRWDCECDCGNFKTFLRSALICGDATTCGCYERVENLAGQKFHHLLVLERAENKTAESGQKHAQWSCRCDCGREIVVLASVLKAGNKKSCGCVRPARYHGGARSREWRCWMHMKDRCRNRNNTKWRLYGGRGITVCERWKSFPAFLEDMGHCPSDAHSLDRYPNRDGNYEPGNVRWASPSEQAKNTRRTVSATHDGRTQCLSDWSRELDISFGCLRKHLRSGKTLAEIIELVARHKRLRYGSSRHSRQEAVCSNSDVQ